MDRQPVFFDDRDRVEFGRCLADIHDRFGVETFAYCLMPNHYHLVLHAPGGGLATAMQRLGLVYTRRTNDRVGRDGPLFRGRYHAIPVTTDAYLSVATRYIHRNPMALRGVASAADYRWSSYRAYLGWRRTPPFLRTDVVTGLFGHDRPALTAFTDQADIGRLAVDPDTVNSLIDMATACFDLERDGDDEVRIPHRMVLLLVAEAVADPGIRDLLHRSLRFPSADARRVAQARARSRANEPAIRRVTEAVLTNIGQRRLAA